MSFESGCEQRNSALDKLKQRTPSLTDQHPNVLYTMPMQTVERLENVLRNTLALQENIRSSMSELATKESLQPFVTAEELLNWVNNVQELNREANTIGSKGNDTEMSRIVVDLKAEIEKIREQIQNIE